MKSTTSSKSNRPNQATPEREPDKALLLPGIRTRGTLTIESSTPQQAKTIYLRLKGLHRKKLSLASNIKIMEGKLSKNCYPTSLDFKFKENTTRNPILKDHWTRSIRKCKTDMTLALLDDKQTMSYILSHALSAKNTMLVKPAEHLGKGCLNIKHQPTPVSRHLKNDGHSHKHM